MNIIKKYYQYIKGQLSEEQLDSFTKDIVKDNMEADALKKKWAGLLENDQEFLELKEEILQQEKKGKVKKLNNTNRGRNLLRYAAGMLLLIAAGYFIWQSNADTSTNALATSHLNKTFAYEDSRDAVEGVDLRIDASDQYRAGNFAAAAALFDQLSKTEDVQNNDRFYWSLSKLYSGDYAGAVQLLEALKDAPNFDMQQETNWFLSLALIKANQLEEAKKELEELIARKGWKHREAKAILNSIQ